MAEVLNSKTMGMHAAENSDKEIKKFQTFFNRLWNGSKPLARLFRTDQSGYLYDTGTNKIIRCDEPIFQLLENLLSMEEETAISDFPANHDRETFLYAAGTIKNAVETENILSLKQALPFGISKHCHNYEELIDSSLEIMVLEITESCPMRRIKICSSGPMKDTGINIRVKENPIPLPML
jgi:hypothetical protein